MIERYEITLEKMVRENLGDYSAAETRVAVKVVGTSLDEIEPILREMDKAAVELVHGSIDDEREAHDLEPRYSGEMLYRIWQNDEHKMLVVLSAREDAKDILSDYGSWSEGVEWEQHMRRKAALEKARKGLRKYSGEWRVYDGFPPVRPKPKVGIVNVVYEGVEDIPDGADKEVIAIAMLPDGLLGLPDDFKVSLWQSLFFDDEGIDRSASRHAMNKDGSLEVIDCREGIGPLLDYFGIEGEG